MCVLALCVYPCVCKQRNSQSHVYRQPPLHPGHAVVTCHASLHTPSPVIFYSSDKQIACVTERHGGPALRAPNVRKSISGADGEAAHALSVGARDPVGGHRVGMRLVPCVYNQR